MAEDAEASFLKALPTWALYALAVGCLTFAAIGSGLTLGLMSLDMIGLEIMQHSKEAKERHAALKISEIRRNGNLLLVTLLLLSTVVNELLPLVLEVLFPGGYVSLVASVLLIMLFGEIIPQAICSRHALQIGAMFTGLVKVIRILFYPVAKPISWCLDTLLGQEMGQIYTRDELKGLVDMHSRNKYGALTGDETNLLKGALDLETKTVAAIMTRAENVFMLNADQVLNRDTLKQVLHHGHSRIPVYVEQRKNVVALLLTKQLIMIDPDDELPIRVLMNKARGHRVRVAPPVYVSSMVSLHDLLNEFQNGRSHLAVIYDDITKPIAERTLLGIVTLEDIMEEILQEEIVDETDVYMDNRSLRPVFTKKDGRIVRTLVPGPPDRKGRHNRQDPTHIVVQDIDTVTLKAPMRNQFEHEDDHRRGARQGSGRHERVTPHIYTPQITSFEEELNEFASNDSDLQALRRRNTDRALELHAQREGNSWRRESTMSQTSQLPDDKESGGGSPDENDRPMSAPARASYDSDEWKRELADAEAPNAEKAYDRLEIHEKSASQGSLPAEESINEEAHPPSSTQE